MDSSYHDSLSVPTTIVVRSYHDTQKSAFYILITTLCGGIYGGHSLTVPPGLEMISADWQGAVGSKVQACKASLIVAYVHVRAT